MKSVATIFLSFLLVSAFSQSPVDTLHWYKCMKGTIGKYPITMQLHRRGQEYSGYYYYESAQQPIDVSGGDSSGVLVLRAYIPKNDIDDDNNNDETFRGRWNGNNYSGTWKMPGKYPSQSFTLIPQASALISDFIIIYTEGKSKLYPQKKKSPQASFYESSVWPTGNSMIDLFLRKELIKVCNGKDSMQEIGEVLLDNKREFFKEYATENKYANRDDTADAEFMNWETARNVEIIYSSPKIICVSASSSSYTGGAHGNFGTSFYSYDLRNRKQLHLADVINVNDSVSLNLILEQKIRKAFNLKSTDQLSTVLFEDSIKANDNFFVTEKGISFNYHPYEIAAYVYGEISLFIPFKEIKSILKDDFVALIKN